jgi:hypothetical protein
MDELSRQIGEGLFWSKAYETPSELIRSIGSGDDALDPTRLGGGASSNTSDVSSSSMTIGSLRCEDADGADGPVCGRGRSVRFRAVG